MLKNKTGESDEHYIKKDGPFGSYMLAGLEKKEVDDRKRAVQKKARDKFHRFFEPALLDGP